MNTEQVALYNGGGGRLVGIPFNIQISGSEDALDLHTSFSSSWTRFARAERTRSDTWSVARRDIPLEDSFRLGRIWAEKTKHPLEKTNMNSRKNNEKKIVNGEV
jgi:hypothetical protein